MSTIDSYTDLKDKLEQSTDDKYRDFTMKICPSKHSFLGVRVPQIRKLASGVPKEKIEELLKYLKFIFAKADKLSTREEYYVKMGLAWLISECFIKFPTGTMDYLLSSKIPAWTFDKTISKICDSYRVDAKNKKPSKKTAKMKMVETNYVGENRKTCYNE